MPVLSKPLKCFGGLKLVLFLFINWKLHAYFFPTCVLIALSVFVSAYVSLLCVCRGKSCADMLLKQAPVK